MSNASAPHRRWRRGAAVAVSLLSAAVGAGALVPNAPSRPAHRRRRLPGALPATPRPYSRAVDPRLGNDREVDVRAVDGLIDERARAREGGDFRRADGILELLLERHGVIVNDSDRTWRAGTRREVKKRRRVARSRAGAKAPPARDRGAGEDEFRLSRDSGPNRSPFSEEEIGDLLSKRRAAQQARDYAFADSVRNTLKANGVYVDDGAKEFRWDGLAYRQRGKAAGGRRGDGSRSPWGLRRSEHSLPLGDDEERAAMDLLARRSDARSARDYAAADALRDELFERYDIRIDDDLREWSAGGDFGGGEDHWTRTSRTTLASYAKSDASAPLPPDEEEYVQRRVDERMRAKRTRNYKLCDAIRDELFDEYDVTIHDKVNLWSAGGDFGEGLSWKHNPKLSNSRDAWDEDGGDFDSGDSHNPKLVRPRNVQARASGDLDGERRVDASGGGVAAWEGGDAPPQRERLERLTVVQLKDELRNAGLTVSGTKAKLIDRLLAGEN